MPAFADHLEEPSEEPGQKPARDQLLLQRTAVVLAPPEPAVDADDIEQDEQVQHADQEQEEAAHTRPDQAADGLQLAVVVEDSADDPAHGQAEADGDQEDDGGVAEREEEPHSNRLPLLLQQLPRRVVDRRYVVGVEGVPEPEHVGGRPERQKGDVADAVGEKQPPAENV